MWSRFFLEKLVVRQLVKKSSTFVESEGLSPHKQEPAIGPYPLVESSTHSHMLYFLRAIFVLSSHTFKTHKGSLPQRFSD
jgi:hypothetical protein